MIKLRNFNIADAFVLRQQKFHNLSIQEIQNMICDWNKHEFQGRYFEMFAIVRDDEIIGTISLYQLSNSVISIGPEVFLKFQRQGFGKQSVALALETCKSKGYKIVCQQVLAANSASIALHKSLGFETDEYCYKNQKGVDVYIFLKSLI
ncbi:MAG: GNAT family N-acetyltransferase [Clostridiales bacterium]|nr:GNAT family N-acetyltransferase [Clostridiales bacterium]